MSTARSSSKLSSIALIAVLAAACMLPASAQAQQTAIVIIRSLTNPADYNVWFADCPAFNLNSGDPKGAACKLQAQQICKGGCSFASDSDDQPPLSLTFGISKYNPTCGWVWDPARRQYVYRCY